MVPRDVPDRPELRRRGGRGSGFAILTIVLDETSCLPKDPDNQLVLPYDARSAWHRVPARFAPLLQYARAVYLYSP